MMELELDPRRKCLGELACRILSFGVQTAACEELFSQWLNIHTTSRNRLSAEKVRMLQIVKSKVKRRNIEDMQRFQKQTNKKRKIHRIIKPEERLFTSAFIQDNTSGLETTTEIEEESDVIGSDTDESDCPVGYEYEFDDDYEDPCTVIETWMDAFLAISDTLPAYDPAPQPDHDSQAHRPSFPENDDPKFPQLKQLAGRRGEEVALRTLIANNIPDIGI